MMMENFVAKREVKGGEEIVTLYLAEVLPPSIRRVDAVEFDYLKFGPADRTGFDKKIVLYSSHDQVSAVYYKNNWGTLYPERDGSKYIVPHLELIDAVRTIYAKMTQSADKTKEKVEAKEETQDTKLTGGDTVKLLMKINGVGEITARNVVKAVNEGKDLDDVPYLQDEVKDDIREVLDEVAV